MSGADDLDRFVEYRRTGSRAIRNDLVEAHLSITDYFVMRYRRAGVAEDDLRQVCFLAVLRAVERFDPDMGVAFSTFASRTIEGDVKRYLRDRTWAVRPPRRSQELHLELRRAEEDLTHELAHSPTVAQLAERLGEDEDHIIEAVEAGGAYYSVSLDAPAGATSEGDASGHRAVPATEDGFELVELRSLVAGMLDELSERDRTIIEMRFFDGMTQPQIAQELGVSQSYLSRLIRSILLRLRKRLDDDHR